MGIIIGPIFFIIGIVLPLSLMQEPNFRWYHWPLLGSFTVACFVVGYIKIWCGLHGMNPRQISHGRWGRGHRSEKENGK